MRRSLDDADEPVAKRPCSACGRGCACAVAAPAYSPERPSPFSAVPDGVLAKIVSYLGLRWAWAARRVCRSWRSAAEEAKWLQLELAVSSHQQLQQLAEAVCRGDVKLGVSASLQLSLGRPRPRPSGDREISGRPRLRASALLGSTCQLLSAISRMCIGLRSVSVDYDRNQPGVDCLNDSSSMHYALGLLAALRPPLGASGRLEEIDLACNLGPHDAAVWQASPSVLSYALAPFPSLRALALLPFDILVSSTTAAAIASACPLLRRLSLCPEDAASVAALAPLGQLEELRLVVRQAAGLEGLRALAAGPAGHSLRSVAIEDGGDHEDAWYYDVSADTLVALAAMPKLEALFPISICTDTRADAGDLAALLRAPRLRSVAVSIAENSFVDPRYLESATRVLHAAPEAHIRKLRLTLLATSFQPEPIIEFLSAARSCIVDFRSEILSNNQPGSRPLKQEEAEAILQCGPQLKNVAVTCMAGTFFDIYAPQALLGLPAHVALGLKLVCVPRDGLPELCHGIFQNGRPNTHVAATSLDF